MSIIFFKKFFILYYILYHIFLRGAAKKNWVNEHW